ncbi:hypothetical protein DYB37_008809 [Aphanomyces astaci]|uniref:non-specific serine/threonine protein kinase n=1 Tax=Aphanomyces astaci TaxID=112090 RepID=A0A3L6V5K8_APHAT|nr:hypothetical protein DYB35_008607 [Aphanomyces astaci]RHZ11909.1 hypothetical protein DYB37_008809 [Aphanomyces astaci]RLO03976.1 hypothetical protein DYB28_007315 [Aphanomyces astaci]
MKVISKSDSVRHDRVRLVHRTMTEREVLAIADHPFIVKLYYAFQTKRFLYMVLQHCEGGPLHQTIQTQTHGFLPEHVARFYAAEVLVVLEYLHMMGVLYDGWDSAPQRKSLATVEYAAPETLASASHVVVPASDWWAFGVLLYQMLFAKTPFQGDNDEDTRQNILHDDLVLPYTPTVSPACRDLLFLLLDKVQLLCIQDQTPPLIPKAQPLAPALKDQLEDPPCACDLVAPDDQRFDAFNFTWRRTTGEFIS